MKKTKLKCFKKRICSFFIILLISVGVAFSQVAVTGNVVDKDGAPVVGATILETGTQNGVVTDFDGKFSIDLQNSPSRLSVSFIGYKNQTIAATSGQSINIVLEEDISQLDEVVVIGYGSTKKTNLTMSVSSVGSDSFEDQPLFRTEDALQSRAAGVSVTKTIGFNNNL